MLEQSHVSTETDEHVDEPTTKQKKDDGKQTSEDVQDGNCHPAAEDEPPAAEDEPPTIPDEPPTAPDEPPTAPDEPPTAPDKPPTSPDEPPPVEDESPCAEDESPTTEDVLPPDGKSPLTTCLLYTSPSPRDQRGSRMPSSA